MFVSLQRAFFPRRKVIYRPGSVFAMVVASKKQDVSAAAPKAHWHTQNLDFGAMALPANKQRDGGQPRPAMVGFPAPGDIGDG
jgi:hypothetical protein